MSDYTTHVYSENAALRQRIAELEKQAKASEWQPIETAPKTSKTILVHCAARKNTYTATWRHDEEYPWSGKWAHFGDGGVFYEAPTHWMPLPAPPKSTCEQKENTE